MRMMMMTIKWRYEGNNEKNWDEKGLVCIFD